MEKALIRRVISLARDSFESIAFEAEVEGATLDEARLCAVRKILEQARCEVYRILEVRKLNLNNDPNVQLAMELQAIDNEIAQKAAAKK